MKKIFLSVLGTLFLSSFSVFAQSSITIKIDNIRASKGKIMIGIGDITDPNNVMGTIVDAKEGSMEVLIEDVKVGAFPIQVFHDENSNNRMDTDSTGKPIEGFGISKDSNALQIPMFQIKDGNNEVSIKMYYLSNVR